MIPPQNETTIEPATHSAVPMDADAQHRERRPIRDCDGDDSATVRGRRANRRRVRFSSTSPDVIGDGPYDLDRVWWQRAELNEIIHAAKTGSKDFGRRGLLMEGLDQAFNRARRIATAVDDEDRLARRLSDIQVNDGLVQWSRYGHSRRGLEKWCSKGQHRVRSEATRQQRAAVAGFEGGDMEELAVIAQVMSKPSRIFARLIGEADAIAIATVAPVEKSVCALGIAGRRFSMPTAAGEQAGINEIFPCSVPAITRSPGAQGTVLSNAPPAPALRRSTTIPTALRRSTTTIPILETLSPKKLSIRERSRLLPYALDSPPTSQVASSPKTVMLPEFIGLVKKK